MTDKQKLAIKRLELNKNTEIYIDYKTKEKTDDIEVVLDLLKEKDKQIDLMSEQLAGLTIFDIGKDEPLILSDKEDIKQYFENKAKELLNK